MIRRLLRRGHRTRGPEGPIWVRLSTEQPHAIDLRWVDELVERARPHLMVRREDELLILVPNKPVKLNATALRLLEAMVANRETVAQVLAREGDTPERRRDLHYFFSDLQSWLSGTLGEGQGRRAVALEPFALPYARYPVIAEVALTYRCNLACAFCYAGCGAGPPPGWDGARAMGDGDVCAVLNRIRHEARCPSVSFTGGEPTLHPSLPRFVRHARRLGMKVNLITNGQLIGDQLAGKLAEAGLHSAQLSLEGPNAAVHDGLVGRPGAFARLWRAAGRLRGRGVRVHTNTTVNRRNAGQLADVVDLIAARGLERLTMNLVIPCGSVLEGTADLHIPYAEAGGLVLSALDRARARGVELVWYSPIPLCVFNTVAHGLGNRGCAAAEGLLHVNPAGDVLPCSSFPVDESLGNLLRQPFDEIWESAAARFFRDKRMIPDPCGECSDRLVCQGACYLYWRAMGLEALGGSPADRPPVPAGFGLGATEATAACTRPI